MTSSPKILAPTPLKVALMKLEPFIAIKLFTLTEDRFILSGGCYEDIHTCLLMSLSLYLDEFSHFQRAYGGKSSGGDENYNSRFSSRFSSSVSNNFIWCAVNIQNHKHKCTHTWSPKYLKKRSLS